MGHIAAHSLERLGEEKILLGCQSRAVWAAALRTGAGRYRSSARVELPECRVARLDPREDHVRHLAADLARNMRA